MTLVGEAGMAVQRPRHRRDQFFAASHHAAIVAIGFVELKLGELRVVLEADAFVAKVAADLIDALVATDEQAFEVQLEGDAQEKVLFELVVIGYKRPRLRAAVERLQDGGFHLKETDFIQVATDGADDARPRDKGLAHLRIGQQVHVTLAKAGLDIAQAMPLIW